MDSHIQFYQLEPDAAARILERIAAFNTGRSDAQGTYAISVATAYRSYYALWRLFPGEGQPLFVRTLGITFEGAVDRAFDLLQNCNTLLEVKDNSYFEACYGQMDDIMPFGRYRGKRMAEIYYVDPAYMLWLANKFEPHNRIYYKVQELARQFAQVHFEQTVQKRNISSVSHFVGSPGDKLKGLQLTVLNVRLQVDNYKPDFYVDQNVLAADRDGNRFVFLIKAAAASLSPYSLSSRSRVITIRQSLSLRSAKVMGHYESRGVRYTRLGYVKFNE